MTKQWAEFDYESLLVQLQRLVQQDEFLSQHVNHEQEELLLKYLALMHKWNKAYNLSAIREPNQMLVKHLLDSLVVAQHLTGYHQILDVGTGAGLPGIPLAIFFATHDPSKHFYLLDSLGKRIQFLKQVVLQLGLTNVAIIQSRVEDYQRDADQLFDCITSRAFTDVQAMTQVCQHLLAPAGDYALLKGKLIDQELADLPQTFQHKATIPLTVPGLDDNERYLLLLTRA